MTRRFGMFTETMQPGHWLGLVLCVTMTDNLLTLNTGYYFAGHVYNLSKLPILIILWENMGLVKYIWFTCARAHTTLNYQNVVRVSQTAVTMNACYSRILDDAVAS